jgi:hypothetical protein
VPPFTIDGRQPNRLEFIGALSLFWIEQGTSFDAWDLAAKWYRFSTIGTYPEGLPEFAIAELNKE